MVSQFKTFNDILNFRHKSNPNDIAFTFLLDGEENEQSLSNKELVEDATKIAAELQCYSKPNDRIILFFHSGLEFIKAFYGCLLAGVVAVPAIPPSSWRSLERILAIMENAGASVILSHTRALNRFDSGLIIDKKIILINVDNLKNKNAFTSHDDINENTIALLQYTSGSTGNPKGVIITHKNLLSNVEYIQQAFCQDKNSIILNWLPLYHDMGLVGSVLFPFYLGVRSILISPVHFAENPIRWLKAISKYKVTTSGGPNFGYDHCTRSIREIDKTNLDLSSWKVAFIGAEPIRNKTLIDFDKTFSPFGFNKSAFQPCYGMAEATLLISANPFQSGFKVETHDGDKPIVSCGKPVGAEVLIVNEKNEEVEENHTGEIWVKGDSISNGYWNNKIENELLFQAKLIDGRGPYLRTGDTGFMKTGELYVTGRIKELIIFNGRNYFPHDLEHTITSNIKEVYANGCACFSIEENGYENLIIVVETNAENSIVKKTISEILKLIYQEFELQPKKIICVRKGTIPKTTSGKIQRYKCKHALFDNSLKKISEWPSPDNMYTETNSFNDVEIIIRELISQLTEERVFDTEDTLFSFGMNSIKLAQFSMLLNEKFNIDISLDFLFNNPTIKLLCNHISHLQQIYNPVGKFKSTPVSEFYELSPTQTGIWFDQQLKPESNSYNVSISIDYKDLIDYDQLSIFLNEIVEENEILRTSFHIVNEKPVQKVKASVKFLIEEISLDLLSPKEAERKSAECIYQSACNKFNISHAPLFRVLLLRRLNAFKIIITSHHLILDGTSLFILANELLSRYEYKSKNRLKYTKEQIPQYRDYIYSLEKNLDTEAGHYWKNKFSSKFRPFYFSENRIHNSSRAGCSVTATLHPNSAKIIRALSEKNGFTNYMVLLSAFSALMHRKSSREDIIIGIPVTGRDKPELQTMLGPFINAIMLRVNIFRNMTFQDVLSQVKNELVNGLKYQNYPLHILAKEVKAPRSNGQVPFSSVFFNGLGFLNKEIAQDAFHAFSENPGLDMNLDLNCYCFENLNSFQFRLDYRKDLFSASEAQSMLDEFISILESFPRNTSEVIDIPVKQKKYFNSQLFYLKGTSTNIPKTTIPSLIELKTIECGELPAIVFKNKIISYAELNGKANTLALRLASYGIKKGDFIPLLMSKSIELPLTIFALMKLGAVFVPMDIHWPEERIKMLLNELSTSVVLSNVKFPANSYIQNYKCIAIEHEHLLSDKNNFNVSIDPEDPIYGMYTSGTSGIPKCAVNLHKGILNRFMYMNKTYGCTKADTILFTSRYIFDASVWQMFWPLINGAKTVIPDDTFGLDMIEVLDLIEKEKVTVTDFVPTVFNLFVDHIENSNASNRIKSLRQLLIGGEAMNAKAIKRFRNILPRVGITNTYGPTETSIGCIFFEIPEIVPDIIPIGKPIDNVGAILLDENKNPVTAGEYGELYLSGICLGTGYLKNQNKTNEVFIENTFPEIESKFLYKTGDIAYILEDGNLQYAGRKDNQVKINGIRVECGEIESVLVKHESVKEAVVLCKKDALSNNYLVGILVIEKSAELLTIHNYLKQVLPSYMVPEGYALVDAIPKTPTGKADQNALSTLSWQRPGITRSNYLLEKDLEIKIKEIWEQLLKHSSLSSNSDFFDSGGDSLKAMQLQNRINKSFNVNISLRDVFINSTLQSQATFINEKKSAGYDTIIPIPPSEDYEVSNAQRRLWVLSQFPEASTAYNIPVVIEMDGKINSEALRNAFQKIFHRHESLRTVFSEDNGILRQRIINPSDFDLISSETNINSDSEIKENISSFIEIPFNLSKGPLMRAELIRIHSEKHILVFVMHHIISDGWSMEILLKELLSAYDGFCGSVPLSLKPLEIQYKDFANWQNNFLKSKEAGIHRDYWLELLSGELPRLNLPLDFNRPPVKTYNGSTYYSEIPKNISKKLNDLCRSENVTTFSALHTAVNILLQRYTSSEDIITGVPVAGRNDVKLENQVGFFVNTLPVRIKLNPDETVSELLKNTKETLIEVFEHQTYPFNFLVDELPLPRDPSRNPLFDVMVALLDQTDQEKSFNENDGKKRKLKINRVRVKNKKSLFELFFNFVLVNDSIHLELEYNSDLFSVYTAERIAIHLNTLLQEIVNFPDKKIYQLNYLSDREIFQLTNIFNHDIPNFTKQNLVTRFEKQVSLTPKAIAIIFESTTITYQELNERANQVAHCLLEKYDFQQEEIVGLMMERSEKLIIALLGILKAGGAYMPVEPDYPEARIKYMLKESKSRIVLSDKERPGYEGIFFLDVNEIDGSKENPNKNIHPEHLSYLIFTSGSTGNPKGVMIEHRNAVSFLDWCLDEFDLNNFQTLFSVTSVCFDLSVFEIFFPLTSGKKIRLLKSPLEINQWLNSEQDVFINTVPSVIEDLLNKNADLTNVRMLNMAGEPISLKILESLSKMKKEIRNLYGPTETTTYSSFYKFTDNFSKSLIGKPTGNSKIFILDTHFQLLPAGIPGEIYICGNGVSRGYLNNETLTNERFINHPIYPKSRLYRTGDLGKWNLDRNIEFLGRNDYQVKIRGYRIELGEIENILRKQKKIKDAVVLCISDFKNDKILVAYLVLAEMTEINELRASLFEFLPLYMIPSHFIFLDHLPVNANGKIDRNKLLEFDLSGKDYTYIAPSTQIEKRLTVIWSEVLKKDRIGIHDNFFSLGGHSLIATQIISRVREEFGIELPFKIFFEDLTISKMADLIITKDFKIEYTPIQRKLRKDLS